MKVRMLALVAGVVLMALPAHAKKYVYSPIVHEGEREFALYTDWRETPSGSDVVGHELEFEWGAGERDLIAVYGVYEDRSSQNARFDKFKAEWIHQFWEQGERPVDTGVYLEYQIRDGATRADKVEVKPLLQKDLGRLTLTGNGVFEKEIGEFASGGTELGYAVKAAWRINPKMTPSIEAFGGFGEIKNITPADQQSHIIGPVLDLRFGPAISWQVGALFGLTDGSEEVRLKNQISYEWY